MADEAVNQEVLQLIRRLHGHYKLGVLSNSPPGLAQWLADWRMLHLFDVIFCSGDEGVAKPDPKAFVATLERLGVERGSAVFIDDTPENVEAAGALGIHAILFTDYRALASELEAFVDPGLIRG
jgi:putative hydrolase of the HAD superfamily